MAEIALSFVIPVRNDAVRLGRCLDTIVAGIGGRDDVEIIVADNGSTDDSAATARARGATVLPLPGLRLGALRNTAAAAARGRILAFVDADHEIVLEWIPAAIEALASPRVGGVGAPCHPPTPGTWVQRLYDRLRRHPTRQEPVEWLGSGNMAVRRAAFEAVGGFDTSLETCEDVDLCRKLRGRGYDLLADHRMRNVHHGDPRTLGDVFFGELWRGRDNIRVSLRPPTSGRTLVSAAIPLANLLAVIAIAVGLLSLSTTGLWLALAAALFLLALVTMRAAVMLGAANVGDWPGALAVAAAYEAGRACAIAGRFSYRRRRTAIA
ncbi:MAG TPA: glycosyltransferase [Vicinamibacterales bacterium]|nr:glycosyltransferase [Vicinamibacterales bacterium]